MTQDPVTATVQPAIQLKITLVDSEPKVWRQLLVPADVNLSSLHKILQAAMGWQTLHDYSFQTGLGAQKSLVDADTQLSDLLLQSSQQPVYYNYDAKSGWRHRLEGEIASGDVDSLTGSLSKLPICTAGAAACPPEGCGGVWGYDQLLAQMEDIEDPEYVQLLDQYGDLDPDEFELTAANARLEALT